MFECAVNFLAFIVRHSIRNWAQSSTERLGPSKGSRTMWRKCVCMGSMVMDVVLQPNQETECKAQVVRGLDIPFELILGFPYLDQHLSTLDCNQRKLVSSVGPLGEQCWPLKVDVVPPHQRVARVVV